MLKNVYRQLKCHERLPSMPTVKAVTKICITLPGRFEIKYCANKPCLILLFYRGKPNGFQRKVSSCQATFCHIYLGEIWLSARNQVWYSRFNSLPTNGNFYCMLITFTYSLDPRCLFDLILYIPVNNFSVMSGRVFLGWTSTKQGLICLAQGHNTVMLVRLQPAALRSRVKHSTTEPLHSQKIHCYLGEVLFLKIFTSFVTKSNSSLHTWSTISKSLGIAQNRPDTTFILSTWAG